MARPQEKAFSNGYYTSYFVISCWLSYLKIVRNQSWKKCIIYIPDYPQLFCYKCWLYDGEVFHLDMIIVRLAAPLCFFRMRPIYEPSKLHLFCHRIALKKCPTHTIEASEKAAFLTHSEVSWKRFYWVNFRALPTLFGSRKTRSGSKRKFFFPFFFASSLEPRACSYSIVLLHLRSKKETGNH